MQRISSELRQHVQRLGVHLDTKQNLDDLERIDIGFLKVLPGANSA